MIVLASTKNLPYRKWLEYRKLGVGGSDASVICGANKYKSPIELWMEKTGQLPETEAGEAAYWGNVLEPIVKAEFTKRTGMEVIPVNHILQNRDYPFMIANLDGVCRHPDYGKCVFEAKTACAFKAGEWADGAVPFEYVLQVHHYMAVTGYMGACVAVLIGGNSFKWIYVERDEELISMLIRTEYDFWERVQDGIPPNIDGSEACTKYLSKQYPQGVTSSKIILPDTAAELIRQYDEACEKGDSFNEQKQRAENLLKEMLGEHEIGVVGERLVVWKNISQTRFDSKTLKIEQPTLYEQYSSKKSYRRFDIKAA